MSQRRRHTFTIPATENVTTLVQFISMYSLISMKNASIPPNPIAPKIQSASGRLEKKRDANIRSSLSVKTLAMNNDNAIRGERYKFVATGFPFIPI